jgi:hypothetical protein
VLLGVFSLAAPAIALLVDSALGDGTAARYRGRVRLNPMVLVVVRGRRPLITLLTNI